jgi:hypothetical protein
VNEYPPVGTLMQCHISDQFYTITGYYEDGDERWVYVEWENPRTRTSYIVCVMDKDVVCTDLIKALL